VGGKHKVEYEENDTCNDFSLVRFGIVTISSNFTSKLTRNLNFTINLYSQFELIYHSDMGFSRSSLARQ
jgi:hypothetical protein